MDVSSSLSKIKVLMLNVNREGWHSGNMIYDMMAVQKACDTIIYGPGWPEYKYTDLKKIVEQLYGDNKPDVIYSYFTPNESVRDVYMSHYSLSSDMRSFPTNFESVKGVLKIFALSDFWSRSPQQYSQDLGNGDFQYCFCCFAPPYSCPSDFYQFFGGNIREKMEFVGYPRCVDPDCYKDYGLDKQYDVITVGSMCNFYPSRVAMHRYLSENHVSLGIRYKNYPHCGANFSHSDFVRENYAKAINQSKMLLSCGGRYHLAMNKIFESMGCGTAYVGERPYGHEELHLKEGENYIDVFRSNFIERIQYYMSHPVEIERITKNAAETFKRYHTIEARAHDFVKLLEERL